VTALDNPLKNSQGFEVVPMRIRSCGRVSLRTLPEKVRRDV
jgi:hypothetical protein